MSPAALIAVGFLFVVAAVVLIIQWHRAFFTYPIQSSVRALIGAVGLLVGALVVPEIRGTVEGSIDWNGIVIRNTQINIAVGSTGATIVAWLCVTLLLVITIKEVRHLPPVKQATSPGVVVHSVPPPVIPISPPVNPMPPASSSATPSSQPPVPPPER